MKRVLVGNADTIEHTFLVGSTPTDATGTPTVEILRDDGTVLVAAGTNATKPANTTGVYTFDLTAVHTSRVDILDVRWSAVVAAKARLEVDRVEVVGGFYCTLREIRDLPKLGDKTRFPDSRLEEARAAVEDLIERDNGVAWVPRYGRSIRFGDSSARFLLPRRPVRRVLAVTEDGDVVASAVWGLWVVERDRGLLREDDWFTSGYRYDVTYEHGHDAPPEDLKEAALEAIRNRLIRRRSDRNDDAAAPELGRDHPTGDPWVDQIIVSHRQRPRIASVPIRTR